MWFIVADINITVAEPLQIAVSPMVNTNPSVGVVSKAELLFQETQQLVEEYGFQVIQVVTFLEFPNMGKDHCLYIDQTANKTYRWNAEDLKYYCVGSDYEAIEIVDGGGANNE